MAVSTSIGSILLLSLICFLPSFSLAKLILKGETHEFPPCPTKPYLPIFEFRPHGSTNYLTYAYGTQPRPATPDRFNARLGKTDDGAEAIFYSLKNVQGSDGGVYECDYAPGIQGMKQGVTVVGSKLDCSIKDSKAFAFGDDLEASCSIPKLGEDQVKLQWKISDLIADSLSLVTKSKNGTAKAKSVSTLHLTAKPKLKGAELTCFTDQLGGIEPCSVMTDAASTQKSP